MKKILALFLATSLLFISCEGDQGPPGRDGLDGGLIVGQLFEIRNVDFTPENDYGVLIDFPSDVEVLESDVVVAYILVGVDNGLDIWEPLPQTLAVDDDILIYAFNHTAGDIELFLDGTVVLDNLSSDLTLGKTFRVAILPADAVAPIDLSSMESLMSVLRQNKTVIN
ncbi:hypothetical protein [Abyssalbus ytuae]|uniref:Collagen-like protein n=1 Tax=Abyssalbus ytuae TaxID=2926907 RepID=A0A9E7A1Y1_9FLAO|nr:hypothetical protein [Abyssalbus ytuae]UOB18246.1 hypothetical protein MQE35_02860 [Abyssalbus ytuae]